MLGNRVVVREAGRWTPISRISSLTRLGDASWSIGAGTGGETLGASLTSRESSLMPNAEEETLALRLS